MASIVIIFYIKTDKKEGKTFSFQMLVDLNENVATEIYNTGYQLISITFSHIINNETSCFI